jgi:hypothetical protein
MCRWVKTHLGADVPVHFTRFHPEYQMKNVAPTPNATLSAAARSALPRGCTSSTRATCQGWRARTRRARNAARSWWRGGASSWKRCTSRPAAAASVALSFPGYGASRHFRAVALAPSLSPSRPRGRPRLLAQVVLLREILASSQGNELVLGIVLALWLLLTGLASASAGGSCGSPSRRR